MSNLKERVQKIINDHISDQKEQLTDKLVRAAEQEGYEVVEVNTEKPWGAYIRIANHQADEFVNDFFEDLSSEEARLGVKEAELSPKFLVFSPRQRLSWQYHNNRAERWKFLNRGHYARSLDDIEPEVKEAEAGDEVQFKQGERHRGGAYDSFTLVAEIWQHINPNKLSNEDDIIRLADDYSR